MFAISLTEQVYNVHVSFLQFHENSGLSLNVIVTVGSLAGLDGHLHLVVWILNVASVDLGFNS